MYITIITFWAKEIIAELWRLEGSPSGAPYSYRKEKENNELIFSWLSWLAVLLMGVYARRRWRRRGGHTPNNRLTETCSLGLPWTSLTSDIHVMINWLLSKQGICWPVSHDHIVGSSLQVTYFFKLTADQVLVFDWIVGSCQVNLLKTGQDCLEAG